MNYVVLASLFVTVSLWRYCMFFYQERILPYRDGYNIFSMFQWIVCAVACIHIFGWLWGIAALAVAMTLLPFLTHFTLGIVYCLCFGGRVLPGLALFGIMVWVSTAITIVSFFF